MEITYSIVLHSGVTEEDLPRIDAFWRQTIRDAVRGKLAVAPELYGRPLRKELKGCRKLRVGDYRIVFQIRGRVVRILAIVHRSGKYQGIKERL